jgi:hypothetical protein
MILLYDNQDRRDVYDEKFFIPRIFLCIRNDCFCNGQAYIWAAIEDPARPAHVAASLG